MDADLTISIRLRVAELAILAARAAERDDFESRWIHQLLTEELRVLRQRIIQVSFCESCPRRVAEVWPRKRRE